MKIQQTNFVVSDTTENYYSKGTLSRPFVRYLSSELPKQPVFGVILLNKQFALIKNVELSQGNLDLALLDTLINEIHATNAHAVVLYHNIGSTLSSNLSVAKEFRRAMTLANVKTLDYIVIDETHYHSTSIDELYDDNTPDNQIFVETETIQQPLLVSVFSFFGEDMIEEKITPLRQVA
jgi:DNA repair protein RadC